MGKPSKKKQTKKPTFGQYVTAHREELIRYVIAAAATAALQYLTEWLLSANSFGTLIAFALRGILMFVILKYWVYGEGGSGAFYTLRQIMLAVMILLGGAYLINNMEIFMIRFLSNFIVFRILFRVIMEFFYFVAYQFFIFKEPKND